MEYTKKTRISTCLFKWKLYYYYVVAYKFVPTGTTILYKPLPDTVPVNRDADNEDVAVAVKLVTLVVPSVDAKELPSTKSFNTVPVIRLVVGVPPGSSTTGI
jgi:hypothetical protein